MLRAALPAGRDARLILLGTLFSSIGLGLTLPFLLVYLSQVRGLPAGSIGLLVAWTGALGLAASPVVGTLIDRLGARRVMLGLVLVLAIGTGALAFVDSMLTAVVALSATGLAGVAIFGANDTILASLVGEHERQRTFGLAFTLLNLGIGLGGLIAGTFVDVSRPRTFQVLYLVNALATLIPAVILLGLPKVGRPAAEPQPTTSDEPVTRMGYRQVLRDRPFLALILFGLVLATVGYAQIEVGFTAFAVGVAMVPAKVIAWGFAGNTLVIVLSQLFVLRWLEGRSRTHALAMVGVLFALAWSVLALAGIAGSHGHPLLAAVGVVAFGAVFGLGETMMTPVIPTITNALAPDELRGRYNAMAGMVFGLSSIIGPATAGPLIGGGLSAVWVGMVVGGSLLASILALWLHRKFTPAVDGRTPAPTAEPAELEPSDSDAPAPATA